MSWSTEAIIAAIALVVTVLPTAAFLCKRLWHRHRRAHRVSQSGTWPRGRRQQAQPYDRNLIRSSLSTHSTLVALPNGVLVRTQSTSTTPPGSESHFLMSDLSRLSTIPRHSSGQRAWSPRLALTRAGQNTCCASDGENISYSLCNRHVHMSVPLPTVFQPPLRARPFREGLRPASMPSYER